MIHSGRVAQSIAMKGRSAFRRTATPTRAFSETRGLAEAETAAVSEQSLSQRELRERAVAEAMAREEEAALKAKQLLELKLRSSELISALNKTPTTLINERLSKLQNDLSKIDQEKVTQLDKELEEFMMQNLKLPESETSNRPWSLESKKSRDKIAESATAIKSTAANSFLGQFPSLKPSADHHPYTTQELYLRHLNHTRVAGNLGSQISDVYMPRDEVKKPKDIKDVTISSLMAAGCHLGHAKSMWRPSTQPFIYGEYDGIHLIDLNETLIALNKAVKVIRGVAAKGGVILYVGTAKHWEQHRALEEAASRSQGYYVSKRWIPGTITNFSEVTKQISGEQRVELDMLDEPTGRPLQNDTIIKPDLVVIVNPVENRNCITECIKARVPTIGLCDTDMEPSLLTYPIPSNDDSMRVSSMMLGVLSKAAHDGITERKEQIRNYREAVKRSA